MGSSEDTPGFLSCSSLTGRPLPVIFGGGGDESFASIRGGFRPHSEVRRVPPTRCGIQILRAKAVPGALYARLPHPERSPSFRPCLLSFISCSY